MASGARNVSTACPSRATAKVVSCLSGVNSISGTGCRKESPDAGFNPALANSLAIHWIATSDPRASDSHPSRASADKKVRSAFRSAGWIESYPIASRAGGCAHSSVAAKIRDSFRMDTVCPMLNRDRKERAAQLLDWSGDPGIHAVREHLHVNVGRLVPAVRVGDADWVSAAVWFAGTRAGNAEDAATCASAGDSDEANPNSVPPKRHLVLLILCR